MVFGRERSSGAGRLGGTLLRGRKNVRKIHAVEMRGELFGLLDPLGGQRRIPAESALAVVVRLTMPHEIQILHPAGEMMSRMAA